MVAERPAKGISEPVRKTYEPRGGPRAVARILVFVEGPSNRAVSDTFWRRPIGLGTRGRKTISPIWRCRQEDATRSPPMSPPLSGRHGLERDARGQVIARVDAQIAVATVTSNFNDASERGTQVVSECTVTECNEWH